MSNIVLPKPTPAPTASLDPTSYRLTAADRCDACQSRAYVAAEVNGTELLYCAHHGRVYEEKLRSIASTWHDESARLFEEQTRVGISA